MEIGSSSLARITAPSGPLPWRVFASAAGAVHSGFLGIIRSGLSEPERGLGRIRSKLCRFVVACRRTALLASSEIAQPSDVGLQVGNLIAVGSSNAICASINRFDAAISSAPTPSCNRENSSLAASHSFAAALTSSLRSPLISEATSIRTAGWRACPCAATRVLADRLHWP